MKKILILLALVSLASVACGQQQNSGQGVEFLEKPMAELMAQSQAEGKLIFVDVYATWCGPCKYMASNVFTQAKAGDYFNATFVNAKFDAEKGEGIDLARKYRVQAYPTFLILDSGGKEVARIVGGDEVDGFIQKVKDVLPK